MGREDSEHRAERESSSRAQPRVPDKRRSSQSTTYCGRGVLPQSARFAMLANSLHEPGNLRWGISLARQPQLGQERGIYLSRSARSIWKISRPLRHPTFMRTEVRAPFARAAIRITGENLQDLARTDVYRNGKSDQ